MRRKFFIPEVIQTSQMDCGPASLKALFGGFGVYLSYGRLREACQTDVDGTSIDTIEEAANRLGLETSQQMVPADMMLLREFHCLPAIVVVRVGGGATHFVVVWRVHGPLVQVMDPACGRVWMPRRRLLDSLYIHEQAVPREAWLGWAQSEDFQAAFRGRLRALGCKIDPRDWPDPAHLDAAIRLTQALVEARQVARGAGARDALARCQANPEQIPAEYWTARPHAEDPEQVLIRGAVLAQATGKRTVPGASQLPESLQAVLRDQPPWPWKPIWQGLREAGLLRPALIGAALLAAAAGRMIEALLFRGFFDLAGHLNLSGQRAGAVAAFAGFLAFLLLIEWACESGLLGMGRQIESRLRVLFLIKIPRLNDRYFQSRLISDMAFRAHSVQLLRQLPELGGQFLRSSFTLLGTVAAIGWLYPAAWIPACGAAAAAVAIPLLFQPALTERELRFREMSGSLSRFYMDALMGLTAVKAHCAQRPLRGAQAEQLRHWAEAGLRQQALLLRAEGLQLGLAVAFLVWLVFSQAGAAADPAGLLLLLYWALSIPAEGSQLAAVAWNYPSLRNTMLRFLEPLASPEEAVAPPAAGEGAGAGVRISMEGVGVVAGGRAILDGIHLEAAAGEHIGVVGISGAGKSSLVGLLLGWHKPCAGRVLVDGETLEAGALARLRRATAWIDPQVHLFNQSLLDNLSYGNGAGAGTRLGVAIENSALAGVLRRLPDGLQTNLGEGGALVSGGEGQRVRMARSMGRAGVRLAILDEPARGLDREQRRAFLERARRHFHEATLFFITHDVGDTRDFDRVLVIEGGRIAEDGDPRELHANPGSRYRALCDEEERVRERMWAHPRWRRLRMTEGAIQETPPGTGSHGS
jgi:ATP-binding cassette subfamily B protein